MGPLVAPEPPEPPARHLPFERPIALPLAWLIAFAGLDHRYAGGAVVPADRAARAPLRQ
jgi:hypothetical protein